MSESGHWEAGHGSLQTSRYKLAGIGALALLGVVFVIQNSEMTEISLLWWSVRMPLVFVLVAMVALGVGLDRTRVWRRNHR